eukprot:gnl/MRDRNA2_/MRDRNA2_93766_c0_seq1.p1 gnl/MRDRNA2_/MRDRNA2_93766_c0~~gnl/MRDRNA2_/MRDRNA2_93766_c0_seq1.p1  ORF type:complete len:367 (+),score=88.01 gnl/MRDRNA2_/MRDRNA2_93766_c0_seq1:64-1164(+)
MLKACNIIFLASFHALAAIRAGKPLPLANLTVLGLELPRSLAELKSFEHDLVDTLFQVAHDVVGTDKEAAVAEAEAVLDYFKSQNRIVPSFDALRSNSTANSTFNATGNASAFHPNGVYGDPKREYVKSIWAKKKEELHGFVVELNATKRQLAHEKYMLDVYKKRLKDEKPKLDELKKAKADEKLVAEQQKKIDELEKLVPEKEKKIPKLEAKVKKQQAAVDLLRINLIKKKKLIGNKFEPECAKVLKVMVDTRVTALSEMDLSNEMLGLDIATHFQVQCPGTIPMPEDKCDKYATSLGKLIDAGAPMVKPASWKASLLQSSAQPRSGNEWCSSFFSDFFDSIFKLVGCFEQGREEEKTIYGLPAQ